RASRNRQQSSRDSKFQWPSSSARDFENNTVPSFSQRRSRRSAPRGRDSIAQGASPGFAFVNSRASPNGARFPFSCDDLRIPGISPPLGLSFLLTSFPRARAPTDRLVPWAIESRPGWGCLGGRGIKMGCNLTIRRLAQRSQHALEKFAAPAY